MVGAKRGISVLGGQNCKRVIDMESKEELAWLELLEGFK